MLKFFSEAKKDDKILFGWAVCKSCFTSILYKAKNGDDTKFYGTKNLSDYLKNCRTPSSPLINNYFKSKQGNFCNRLCPDVVEAVSINLESYKNSLLWIKLSEFWLFSSNLLGPRSGFIWVTWVQGKQKWPSFISATNSQLRYLTTSKFTNLDVSRHVCIKGQSMFL